MGFLQPPPQHKHTRWAATTLPPAASSSLSMETSAMDPNRFAAAPYEPTAGARCPGLGSLWQDPLIGAPQWHPSKNWEMGGASVLGGRHFFNRHNNQPKFGCGGGGGRWWWDATEAERVGRNFSFCLGRQMGRQKIRERDRASALSGHH
jgi:hypothetical protein